MGQRIAAEIGFPRQNLDCGNAGGRDLRRNSLGALPQVFQRRGQQREQRDGAFRQLGVLIQTQRGGERSERELIHATNPHERVLRDLLNE